MTGCAHAGTQAQGLSPVSLHRLGGSLHLELLVKRVFNEILCQSPDSASF